MQYEEPLENFLFVETLRTVRADDIAARTALEALIDDASKNSVRTGCTVCSDKAARAFARIFWPHVARAWLPSA